MTRIIVCKLVFSYANIETTYITLIINALSVCTVFLLNFNFVIREVNYLGVKYQGVRNPGVIFPRDELSKIHYLNIFLKLRFYFTSYEGVSNRSETFIRLKYILVSDKQKKTIKR